MTTTTEERTEDRATEPAVDPTTLATGPTTLRNVRIEDALWFAAEEPCQRIAGKGGRSKVARDALLQAVERETDPTWQALKALATERETDPEALQRVIVEQYLAKVQRDRENQRRRRGQRTN